MGLYHSFISFWVLLWLSGLVASEVIPVDTPPTGMICEETTISWSDSAVAPFSWGVHAESLGFDPVAGTNGEGFNSFPWTPTPGQYDPSGYNVYINDADGNSGTSDIFQVLPNPALPPGATDCDALSSSSTTSAISSSQTSSSQTSSSPTSSAPTSSSSSTSSSQISSSRTSSIRISSSLYSSRSSSRMTSARPISAVTSRQNVPSSTIVQPPPVVPSSTSVNRPSLSVVSTPAVGAPPTATVIPITPGAPPVPAVAPSVPVPAAETAAGIAPTIPTQEASAPAASAPSMVPVNSSPITTLASSAAVSSVALSSTSSLVPKYTPIFPPAGDPASQDFVNISISVADPRITYSGDGWSNSPSSCNVSVQSARNDINGQSLSFTFVGTSVYMAAASTDKSGGYVVSVDNQAVSSIDAFAGTSAAPSCGFAWSSFDMSNTAHTVVVNLTGQSAQAAADNITATSFELDGFTISQSAPDTTEPAQKSWANHSSKSSITAVVFSTSFMALCLCLVS